MFSKKKKSDLSVGSILLGMIAIAVLVVFFGLMMSYYGISLLK